MSQKVMLTHDLTLVRYWLKLLVLLDKPVRRTPRQETPLIILIRNIQVLHYQLITK